MAKVPRVTRIIPDVSVAGPTKETVASGAHPDVSETTGAVFWDFIICPLLSRSVAALLLLTARELTAVAPL